MATTPMSLVDAIAKQGLETARSQTSVVRVGTVTSIARTGGQVDVQIGGTTVTCPYITLYYPKVNDVVAVLVTRDSWIVIGPMGGGNPGYAGTVTGTWAPGWGPGNYSLAGYRFGPFCWWRFSFARTGAQITPNATTGNISDTLLFTMDDDEMKSAYNSVTFHARGPSYFGDVYLTTNGDVTLSAVTPGSVIATGDAFVAIPMYIGYGPAGLMLADIGEAS